MSDLERYANDQEKAIGAVSNASKAEAGSFRNTRSTWGEKYGLFKKSTRSRFRGPSATNDFTIKNDDQFTPPAVRESPPLHLRIIWSEELWVLTMPPTIFLALEPIGCERTLVRSEGSAKNFQLCFKSSPVPVVLLLVRGRGAHEFQQPDGPGPYTQLDSEGFEPYRRIRALTGSNSDLIKPAGIFKEQGLSA